MFTSAVAVDSAVVNVCQKVSPLLMVLLFGESVGGACAS